MDVGHVVVADGGDCALELETALLIVLKPWCRYDGGVFGVFLRLDGLMLRFGGRVGRLLWASGC